MERCRRVSSRGSWEGRKAREGVTGVVSMAGYGTCRETTPSEDDWNFPSCDVERGGCSAPDVAVGEKRCETTKSTTRCSPLNDVVFNGARNFFSRRVPTESLSSLVG